MYNNNRLAQLFHKYLANEATENERQEFLDYVDDPLCQPQIQELLANAFENQEELTEIKPVSKSRILNQIIGNQPTPIPQPKSPYRLWMRFTAAAAIILIVGAGLFYFNNKPNTVASPALAKTDVRPGGNKAYLTLANGQRIALTDAKNGQLAFEAGATITKTANGLLVYSKANNQNELPNHTYNAIEIPRGGQYRLQLPDGTMVWLNAASSLKYPVSFAAMKERKVMLQGEAYFEVAKDSAHPFIVVTDRQEVKVLGTHFNINAYKDEPITSTTLLEGSVKVSTAASATTLQPGEQSNIASSSNNILVSHPDTEEAIAWKNGYFLFDNEELTSILRKLSRWYDVDIDYQIKLKPLYFGGMVSRSKNISAVLKIMELTGNIHFKVQGRRIIVMP